MNLLTQESRAERFERLAVVGAMLLLVIVPAIMTLARYDSIPKIAGLAAFLAGGGLAIIVLALAFASLWVERSKHLLVKVRVWAVAGAALGYVWLIGSCLPGAWAAPPLHDVTTSLASPPRFEVLPLRENNLAGIGSFQNWRRVHAKAYGDLRTRQLDKPVAAVTARALALARAQGWSIVASDLGRGRIEATATVSYLRFHDDVIIAIRPTPRGLGALVDMRSVSREGTRDFGRNARRIRTFLDALMRAEASPAR